LEKDGKASGRGKGETEERIGRQMEKERKINENREEREEKRRGREG
jgi:hypothetical protein